jgi:hypothetical protein
MCSSTSARHAGRRRWQFEIVRPCLPAFLDAPLDLADVGQVLIHSRTIARGQLLLERVGLAEH